MLVVVIGSGKSSICAGEAIPEPGGPVVKMGSEERAGIFSLEIRIPQKEKARSGIRAFSALNSFQS
jgi:hypothetical protein